MKQVSAGPSVAKKALLVMAIRQAERSERTGQQSFVRMLLESILFLGMAVSICRVFFAEGYMISTGSMAPTLLGYHRQVTCPSCGMHFARGASGAGDSAQERLVAAHDGFGSGNRVGDTQCPNCQEQFSTLTLPRNEGDQLLVQKNFYYWRDPLRWEVIVFRNPRQPTQAYVKRVVGLPGEQVRLLDGNVSIDGVLQRKPLARQLAMRILVDDHAHRVRQAEDSFTRWTAEDRHGSWKAGGNRFVYTSSARHELDWLVFRYRVQTGGTHERTVPLEDWPVTVREPVMGSDRFEFDPNNRQLRSRGVIPPEEAVHWSEKLSGHPAAEAVQELARLSQFAPITDVCGYNSPQGCEGKYPVRDLMVEFRIERVPSEGRLVVGMHTGSNEVQAVFDFTNQEVRLIAPGHEQVFRRGALPRQLQQTSGGAGGNILMSLFDQQVIVAMDGQELFAPLKYKAADPDAPLPEIPIRIGALTQGVIELGQLRVYRDVYYRPFPDASRETITLGADEFFVLGDNSPISVDSRVWNQPAIKRRHLIGKPFVVHLPSKQARMQWPSQATHVRIPDWSRVRYIR